MNQIILLLNLLLIQNLEDIYVSNEFGMALKKIGWYRRDEYAYVLVVTETESEKIKTLFQEQKEIKRWEISRDEERIYIQGQLSEKKRFDRRGRVIEEAVYAESVLDHRSLYRYGRLGLSQSETYDGSGQILYRDRYALSAQGELRSVTRTWNDGTVQILSLTSGAGNRSEERDSAGNREIVYRYDDRGNLQTREVWEQGRLLSRESTEYDGTRATRTVINDFDSGQTIHTSFAVSGHPVEEIVLLGDTEIERTQSEWNAEGQKIRMQRSSDRGLELWLMHYADGELEREEYWLRGALQKITRYLEEDQRLDELYRGGAVFVRILYRGEDKLREEFVENGKVVRVRDFEP